jgi:AAA15 family ATPase/GTPase
MLSKLRVQHYKSLFDIEVDLEPLTVFIGPNGSGKSNICETLSVLSDFLQRLIANKNLSDIVSFFIESLTNINKNQQIIESKFWQGKQDYFYFEVSAISKVNNEDIVSDISVRLDYSERIITINTNKTNENLQTVKYSHTSNIRDFLVAQKYSDSLLGNALQKVSVYDFAPISLSNNIPSTRGMDKTGQGIVDALADILLSNRKNFETWLLADNQAVSKILGVELEQVENLEELDGGKDILENAMFPRGTATRSHNQRIFLTIIAINVLYKFDGNLLLKSIQELLRLVVRLDTLLLHKI